jgi:hypothetical protein
METEIENKEAESQSFTAGGVWRGECCRNRLQVAVTPFGVITINIYNNISIQSLL